MSIPMPNDALGCRTVVASCYYRDLGPEDQQHRDPGDTWPDLVYLVLLLNPESPFFTVAHVDNEATVLDSHDEFNIVNAVQVYQDWGGDI